MIAVLVELDLHIGHAQSLKDKRSVVKRLKNRLVADLKVSVAETAHQDLWQRCGLGIAIATSSEVEGRNVARKAEDLIERIPEVQVLDVHTEIVATER